MIGDIHTYILAALESLFQEREREKEKEPDKKYSSLDMRYRGRAATASPMDDASDSRAIYSGYTWSAIEPRLQAPRRRRRSLRLSEIINATLDKLIFISDILANYEMQLFSRPVAAFNVAPVSATTTLTTTTSTTMTMTKCESIVVNRRRSTLGEFMLDENCGVNTKTFSNKLSIFSGSFQEKIICVIIGVND